MDEKSLPVCYLLMMLALFWTGCASWAERKTVSYDECIRKADAYLRTAPTRKYLFTLDKQQVLLQEFFVLCEEKFPYCVLYPKFYWWKNEIREIVSETEDGPVHHKIRIYHNVMSTCSPDSIQPSRTHGDVAEFYDEKGRFMGLAVYMGQGLYCPLPYSRYKGKGFLHRLFPT